MPGNVKKSDCEGKCTQPWVTRVTDADCHILSGSQFLKTRLGCRRSGRSRLYISRQSRREGTPASKITDGLIMISTNADASTEFIPLTRLFIRLPA